MPPGQCHASSFRRLALGIAMYCASRATAKSHGELSAVQRVSLAAFAFSMTASVGSSAFQYRRVVAGRRSTLRRATAKIPCVRSSFFPHARRTGRRRAHWLVPRRHSARYGVVSASSQRSLEMVTLRCSLQRRGHEVSCDSSLNSRLTRRSTGPAAAGRLGPVGGTRYIFADRANPSRRVGPVSSTLACLRR